MLVCAFIPGELRSVSALVRFSLRGISRVGSSLVSELGHSLPIRPAHSAARCRLLL
jgi:hypothetical protein